MISVCFQEIRPIDSSTDLVVNAQTARTLGLTVPATMIATTDEVIE